MDYGAFPPGFNSARMYAGPGPGSMLAAAAAWNGLAAELRSVASSYGSVISGLIDGPWLGPSSTAMATAAMPYVAWLSATAGQAELTATQAQAAVGAYQAAFAMTVPPPLIAENRAQLMTLVATNLLGQNTPAIAANQAQYGEMWAQDATAMYGYAANSAAITATMTPLTPAPETTNLAGLAAQGAAGTANTGTSTGTGVQSALSKLVSSVSPALQSLTSPGSSTSSTSGLSGILSGLLGGSSSGSSTGGGLFGALSSSGFSPGGLLENYATMPGWFGMFLAEAPLQALMSTPIGNGLTAAAAPAADVAGAAAGAADAAAAGAADAAAGAAAAGGVAGADLGGLAGLGEAASVGALSVPPSWGWAASGLPAMLGGVPLALPGIDLGATGGLPMAAGLPLMMGGLPQAAAAGAVGAAVGAAGAKYLPRLSVVARSPAAGYSAESAGPPTPKYPVPVGFPTNGHAPPGYQPAIVYLPTNTDTPADV